MIFAVILIELNLLSCEVFLCFAIIDDNCRVPTVVESVDVGDGLLELINPEIIEATGEQYEVEGCLSLPGKSGITKRPMCVKVKAQNREGRWCQYKGEGLKARAFCHEIDHLDGHLYTERLAPEEVINQIKLENDID